MNLMLLGAPGSGKGTQANILSELYGLKKISLGDILRDEVKADSFLGKEVKRYMDEGTLVPDEVVSKVIEQNVSEGNFLLDGFPRNLNQAQVLDEILERKKQKLEEVIYLDVDENTIVERLSQRIVCKNCSANYHLVNMPPKINGICDKCGLVLSQRDDDKPDVIRKRWQVFLEQSKPLCVFYEKKGILVNINGNGNKDEIFDRIKKHFASRDSNN